MDDQPQEIHKEQQKTPLQRYSAHPQAPESPAVASSYPQAQITCLPYHRLALADSKSRWWKPLIEGILGVAFYLILSVLMGVGYVLYLLASGKKPTGFDLASLQNESLVSPATFLMVFGSVAAMWPALLLARLITGPKPWGLVHSVLGRIRWGWLLLCASISVLVLVIVPGLFTVIAGDFSAIEPVNYSSRLALMLSLIFLVVPLQCYAEELVFRGYLMQTIGRWLKSPAWAITLPAVLFMFGHAYDFWGQASILAMGICTGFLTWYTGGLEAGIALHTVNNLYLMTLGVLGVVDPFAQGGSTATDFIFALIFEVILVLALMYAAKRKGVAGRAEYRVPVN